MNFFEQQESARLITRRFAVLFALFAIPSLVCFTVLTVFLFGWVAGYTPFEFMEDLFHGRHLAVPMVAGGIATLVLVCILLAIRIERDRDAANHLLSTLDATEIPPGTQDPQLRQALNACEEIALAAGIPPPTLYAWNTPALNAFPVGRNVAGASIFVSQGALESLSRDEMQALLAHGIGQIANGDMALNGRLATFLFIYQVTPRVAMNLVALPAHILMHLGLSPKNPLGGLLMLPWLFTGLFPSLLLALVSAPPYLFAAFVKWLLVRKRKVLADATAIRLTRNPQALRDALVKTMAKGSYPARVPGPLADLSVACFASVKGEWMNPFPPLAKRIRALDPSFDLYRDHELQRMAARSRQVRHRWAENSPAQKEVRARKQQAFIQNVAVTAAQFVASAKASAPAVPEVLASIVEPEDARAVLLALLVDRKPDVQARQLRALRKAFCEKSIATVLTALGQLQPSLRTERTLALDRHLPALRSLPAGELRRLRQAIRDIRQEDDLVDVFEYAVARVASVFIDDILEPGVSHGAATVAERRADLSVLCCVVAQQYAGADARRAYEAGMRPLDPDRQFEFTPSFQWAGKLDYALEGLNSLLPLHKELVLDAIMNMLKFDRQVTPAERELMRAIASSLHCPVPRLA